MQPAEQELMNRAERLAARWNLHLETPLKRTTDRLVYKVKTPDGQAILKLNRKFGSEGGAVPFLRGMPDGIGAKLLRVSPLRRAMLLDWLDGPTLEDMVAQGAENQAEKLLAKAAASLATAEFGRFRTIQRLNTRLKKRFANYARTLKNSAQGEDFARVMSLFDTLVETMPSETAIHGDLYFGNVINTTNGPRLIDPKGFRADPAADFATAFNPPQPNPSIAEFRQLIERRSDVYASAIAADPLRLVRWGAVIRADKSFHRSVRSKSSDQPDPYLQTFLDLAKA